MGSANKHQIHSLSRKHKLTTQTKKLPTIEGGLWQSPGLLHLKGSGGRRGMRRRDAVPSSGSGYILTASLLPTESRHRSGIHTTSCATKTTMMDPIIDSARKFYLLICLERVHSNVFPRIDGRVFSGEHLWVPVSIETHTFPALQSGKRCLGFAVS